jgi:hypothetical protein
MLYAYFIAVDSKNAYITGYDTSGSDEIVDACSTTITGCTTIVTISGGFPGGVAIDQKGNLYVNNQFGTLYSYSGCPSACSLTGSFTYSNGSNPRDYTAIALDNKAKNIWGANFYYCSATVGVCTYAQRQSLPLSGAAFNGNTPEVTGDEAVGLAVVPAHP